VVQELRSWRKVDWVIAKVMEGLERQVDPRSFCFLLKSGESVTLFNQVIPGGGAFLINTHMKISINQISTKFQTLQTPRDLRAFQYLIATYAITTVLFTAIYFVVQNPDKKTWKSVPQVLRQPKHSLSSALWYGHFTFL
jgi:hypothetical protein